MTVTLHGDYVAKGVGLAHQDEGTIVIDTIPDDAELVGGVLYWAFEDEAGRPEHRRLHLNGRLRVHGELIGEVQRGRFHSFAYRALLSRDELLDAELQPVGGPVPPTPSGNGTYVISGYPNEEPTEPQGATLVLVYEHEAMPARDIAFNDGNVMPPTSPPPPFINDAPVPVAGFRVGPPAAGRCTFVVGNGDDRALDQLLFRSEAGRLRWGGSHPFDGSDGPYWDTEPLPLDGMLRTGETTGTAIIRIWATKTPHGLFRLDDLVWTSVVLSVTTSNPVHPDPGSLFY